MKTQKTPLNSSKKLVLLGVALLSPALAAQAAQGPQPTICTRACWVARSASAASQMGALSRAIIHHTAGASDYTTDYETGKAKVRGIQNIHMDGNGWSDIGYHFVVSAGGHIYEGRYGSMSSLPQGAHDGNNGNSFGFNIMGNYADLSESGGANQIPTTASLNSLYDVIAWRMPSAWSPYGSGTYNGNTVGVLDGHRKVKATACPGNNIHNVHITSDYNGGNARNGVNSRKNGTASNPPYYFDSSAQGWTVNNASSALLWTACCGWPGIIYANQVGTDMIWHSPATSFTGAADASINVQVNAQGTAVGHDLQMYWKSNTENNWDAAKSSPLVTYSRHAEWIRLTLPVFSSKWAGQVVNQLRLDLDNAHNGNTFHVNHVYTQVTPRYWFGSDAQGWTAGNGICCGLGWTATGWPGIIYFDQNAADANIIGPVMSNFLGGANDQIRIRIQPNGPVTTHDMQIFFTTAGSPSFSADKSTPVVYYTAGAGTWADLTIPIGNVPAWSGDFVRQLRVDVAQASKVMRYHIDYITIQHASNQQ